MVFVAENEQGERLGFATVSHSTHFTGEGQACEQWACEQGYRILSLTTGAANEQALGF